MIYQEQQHSTASLWCKNPCAQIFASIDDHLPSWLRDLRMKRCTPYFFSPLLFKHAGNGLLRSIYIGFSKMRIFITHQLSNIYIHIIRITYSRVCYYAIIFIVSILSKRREYTNFNIHIVSQYSKHNIVKMKY